MFVPLVIQMSTQEKSNVIWIIADQLPAHALGCNGNPNVNTPNIDRLALTGINFTNATAGYPLCCPFRGSMLTSKYPHHCVNRHEGQLNPEQETIAHVFNEQGYDTAYFGKWHLDGFPEWLGRATMHIIPPERRGGFKMWMAYENNNSQWDTWVHGERAGENVHYRLPGYETDELTTLLINYIKKRTPAPSKKGEAHEPFFAVLSVQPPHNPYIAPAKFMKRFNPSQIHLRENVPSVPEIQEKARKDLAGAYAMIENLDWNIGRILDTLSSSNILHNTHVIVFSDHGDMHGSHGYFKKTTPYSESINIPLIISGEKPMGYDMRGVGTVQVPFNHVDIAPTTLGLCGIEKPEWMEGTDYSRYRIRTRKKDDEPDSAYLQYIVPTGHRNCVDKPWRGIVTRDGWKYACFSNGEWLMFNLEDDPFEQVNLAHQSQHVHKKHQLHERLERWMVDTGDDFPLPTLK